MSTRSCLLPSALASSDNVHRVTTPLSSRQYLRQGPFITSGLATGEDEVDGKMGTSGVGAEGGSNIGDVATAEQGDSEVAAGGEALGGGGADVAAIFVERAVPDGVARVLAAPMASSDGEQSGSVRLLDGQAGDGSGDFGLHRASALAATPPPARSPSGRAPCTGSPPRHTATAGRPLGAAALRASAWPSPPPLHGRQQPDHHGFSPVRPCDDMALLAMLARDFSHRTGYDRTMILFTRAHVRLQGTTQ